jgi:hypothetical protein
MLGEIVIGSQVRGHAFGVRFPLRRADVSRISVATHQ